mgnify:CR=1 FL=1
MFISKNKKSVNSNFDPVKEYDLSEAVILMKKLKFTKFDESVDIAMNLGVDPRHADQNIRINTSLPHGTGKEIKVLVVVVYMTLVQVYGRNQLNLLNLILLFLH